MNESTSDEYGLPGYARNSKESVTSILEMVRVAKEQVVFHAGWDQNGNLELGIKRHKFSFPMQTFVEQLSQYGINNWTTQVEKNGLKSQPALHLDVNQKNETLLQQDTTQLLSMYG